MNNIAKPRTHNREDRSLHHPALTVESVRLARIKRKAPHEKGNAELAYEEGVELGDAFPHERASIIAGALHGLPSLQSMLVLVGGVDDKGRPTFASGVVDVAAYFGEEA